MTGLSWVDLISFHLFRLILESSHSQCVRVAHRSLSCFCFSLWLAAIRQLIASSFAFASFFLSSSFSWSRSARAARTCTSIAARLFSSLPEWDGTTNDWEAPIELRAESIQAFWPADHAAALTCAAAHLERPPVELSRDPADSCLHDRKSQATQKDVRKIITKRP
eukprot:SAG31_NODE_1522_length_8012_cov_6.903336_7_plen_165_part_00